MQTGQVKRLLSGIRPSGPLHLGHYAGILRQWLALPEGFDCFFLVADLQALAIAPESAAAIPGRVKEVLVDLLAAGLDPDRCHFVLQSRLPEVTELTAYLQPFVRTGELRSNPSVREEARSLGKGDLGEAPDEVEFSFLGYPVAQAADILLFSPTPPNPGDRLVVPVGRDQVSHVAFARRVAQRFNRGRTPVFLEPEEATTETSTLPGTDGGFKMGKSLDNAILLQEDEESCARKIRTMCTDPLRLAPHDPGHPGECPCFLIRRAIRPGDGDLELRCEECKRGETDCADCKEELLAEVVAFLAPIKERRAELERRPEFLRDLLSDGTLRAREVAGHTLAAVRDALHLGYPDLIRETP